MGTVSFNFFKVMENSEHKGLSVFRLYLGVVSIVGLIGIVVALGTAGYAGLNRAVISDDEYVQNGSNSYPYNSCTDNLTDKAKTESPADCQKRERAKMLMEREYNLKTTLIGSGVWGTLFFLMFLLHYPFFLRQYHEKKRAQ